MLQQCSQTALRDERQSLLLKDSTFIPQTTLHRRIRFVATPIRSPLSAHRSPPYLAVCARTNKVSHSGNLCDHGDHPRQWIVVLFVDACRLSICPLPLRHVNDGG